jgi:hypothetical protein
MRKRRSRLQRLGFEGLEDRSMLSGTVTIDFIASSLLITGDNAANAIAITDTGTNLIITGIQGGTTGPTALSTNTSGNVLISGNVATIAKAPLDGDIFINLLNGRDELSIDGINVTAGDNIPGKLKINMGEGNDTLTFGATARNNLSSDATIDLDEGEDILTIDGLEVRSLNEGSLFIFGGFGADTITIGANDTNTIEGDFNIDTGTGNDIVAVDRTNAFADFSIDTSGGADTVDLGRENPTNFLDSAVQVRGNLIIDTGISPDTVRLDAVLVVQHVLISTGDGDDTVLIGDDPAAASDDNDQAGASARGDFVISTGVGEDSVTINFVTGANAALVNLGLGIVGDSNQLVVRNSSFSNDIAILGGVSADTIDIDALNAVTNLFISTGGGNDSIDLQGTLVTQGLLTINSGAGDDSVRVDNSVTARLVIFAEAGINDADITANLIDDFFLDLGQEGGSANLTGVVRLRGFARGLGAVGTGNLFGSIQFEGFTLG